MQLISIPYESCLVEGGVREERHISESFVVGTSDFRKVVKSWKIVLFCSAKPVLCFNLVHVIFYSKLAAASLPVATVMNQRDQFVCW